MRTWKRDNEGYTEDQLERYHMMRDVYGKIQELNPSLHHIFSNSLDLTPHPRSNPGHGGTAFTSRQANNQVLEAFVKSMTGKDRPTQEKFKSITQKIAQN